MFTFPVTFFSSSAPADPKVYTLGYSMGGNKGGSATATILKVVFSSDTFSELLATIDTARFSSGHGTSSTKGYCCGGVGPNNKIDQLTFASEASTELSATLGTATDTQGVSSTTKAYMMGGSNAGYLTTIQNLTFSDESVDNNSDSLDTGRNRMGAVYSDSKGYCAGFEGGGTEINEFVFSSELSAASSTVLSESTGYAGCYIQDPDKCFWMGGHNGSSYQNNIDKMVFSSETRSTISDNLTTATGRLGGVTTNETNAYALGGDTGSYIDDVEKFVFSSETTSTLSAKLADNEYREKGGTFAE